MLIPPCRVGSPGGAGAPRSARVAGFEVGGIERDDLVPDSHGVAADPQLLLDRSPRSPWPGVAVFFDCLRTS